LKKFTGISRAAKKEGNNINLQGKSSLDRNQRRGEKKIE